MFIGVAIDALINQSRMVSRVIIFAFPLKFYPRSNERTKKKCRSWRERELLVGRSDVPSDFCFASDKERHFNSLDHGDEHSRHTLSDAPLVSVPKKNLKGNYNQTVLRFAKSNVNEAVFVTCFRICFLCVFPFKGSFVSPMTHATNRISTRNTHIRALMHTRRSTRFLNRDRSRFLDVPIFGHVDGRIVSDSLCIAAYLASSDRTITLA